VLYSAVRWDEW
jgi:hypothetical protein